MALPMVHLLVALKWAQDKPELKNNPDYYLGAVSPDAIHVRDGDDKSRKNEIHLNNWRRPDPDSVVEYWETHFTPFDIGYGIHVLTDGQWAERFRADLPGILLPNGKPNPELYYNDTCVSDFALYAESEHTNFLMEMVQKGTAPKDHPLLTEYEFAEWQKATIGFYQRPCPMNNPVQFIDREYIERFMEACTALLDTTYERVLNMNATQKSIMERRSNRAYSCVPLSDAEIKNLADAALASPTAKNYQDWQFIFVRNKELLHEFSAEFSAVMSGNPAIPADYDLLYGAPLFVVITLPEHPQSRFAEVDAGIAVQNLALSAQGMGLGSVILGRPKDVFCGPNGAEWEKRFGFPENHHFAIGIAIGRPTMTKDAHPFRQEKITFID